MLKEIEKAYEIKGRMQVIGIGIGMILFSLIFGLITYTMTNNYFLTVLTVISFILLGIGIIYFAIKGILKEEEEKQS